MHSQQTADAHVAGVRTKEEKARSTIYPKYTCLPCVCCFALIHVCAPRFASSGRSKADEVRAAIQRVFLDKRDPGRVNVLRAFQRFDSDLSGAIELPELRAVLSDLGVVDAGDDVTLNEIIKRCDKQGQGVGRCSVRREV